MWDQLGATLGAKRLLQLKLLPGRRLAWWRRTPAWRQSRCWRCTCGHRSTWEQRTDLSQAATMKSGSCIWKHSAKGAREVLLATWLNIGRRTISAEIPIPLRYVSLPFCLRPSAKDQGITWVVLVLVVILHHLVHLLFKINLSEKKFSLPGNRTGVLILPSQALSQLSYSTTDTNSLEIFYLT